MKNQYITLSNRVINNPQLSADSLATIAWIMANQGLECKIDKGLIKLRFGWGGHTWYRVSRELKKHGLINEVIGNKGSQLYFKIENPLDSSDYLESYLESTSDEIK